jgi:hypothetical protein
MEELEGLLSISVPVAPPQPVKAAQRKVKLSNKLKMDLYDFIGTISLFIK